MKTRFFTLALLAFSTVPASAGQFGSVIYENPTNTQRGQREEITDAKIAYAGVGATVTLTTESGYKLPVAFNWDSNAEDFMRKVSKGYSADVSTCVHLVGKTEQKYKGNGYTEETGSVLYACWVGNSTPDTLEKIELKNFETLKLNETQVTKTITTHENYSVR